MSISQSHSQNPNPIFWRISNECPLDVCWISAGCPPDIRSFRRDLDWGWNCNMGLWFGTWESKELKPMNWICLRMKQMKKPGHRGYPPQREVRMKWMKGWVRTYKQVSALGFRPRRSAYCCRRHYFLWQSLCFFNTAPHIRRWSVRPVGPVCLSSFSKRAGSCPSTLLS